MTDRLFPRRYLRFDWIRSAAGNLPSIVLLARAANRSIHHELPAALRERGLTEPETRWSDARPPLASLYSDLPSGTTIPTYPYSPTLSEPLSACPDLRIPNPVLSAADVTDYGRVEYVADPFLFVSEDEGYHLFFEVYNGDRRPDAVIGHATSPDGGRHWRYDRVVLEADSHLSFPYVFEWDGTHYMLPEQGGASGESVVLYAAREFPTDWSERAVLISANHPVNDTVLFRWKERWWALVGGSTAGDRTYAYFSDDLTTEGWSPHRENPIVTDRPAAARPGGRPIVRDNRIIAFFQDCVINYGEKVRGYEITELTPSTYVDRELARSPLLRPVNRAIGWNAGRMHHIDPWYTGDGWLCAVDGDVGPRPNPVAKPYWSIGMYVSPDPKVDDSLDSASGRDRIG